MEFQWCEASIQKERSPLAMNSCSDHVWLGRIKTPGFMSEKDACFCDEIFCTNLYTLHLPMAEWKWRWFFQSYHESSVPTLKPSKIRSCDIHHRGGVNPWNGNSPYNWDELKLQDVSMGVNFHWKHIQKSHGCAGFERHRLDFLIYEP